MGVHVTKRCVDALADLLRVHVPDVDNRVTVGRITPYSANELPAIGVDVASEEITVGTIHAPRDLMRAVAIDVAVVVQHADAYDEEAYRLLLAVEHAIAGDRTLGGLAMDLTPEAVEIDRSDTDQPVVRALLRVRADLAVMDNAADSPIT